MKGRTSLLRAFLLCSLIGLFGTGELLAQGDDCGTAVAVVAGSHVGDGPSAGAGASVAPCPNDDASATAGTNADWYVFSAPSDGTMTVTTCGLAGGTDTRVSIHSGACGTLTCVGGDDDCDPGASGFESTAIVSVTGGVDYFIEWDDRWSTSGYNWDLNFSACIPATATASTIDNCGGGTFTIDVDLTALGSAATVNITEDVNGGGATTIHTGVSALMIYALGPYTSGDVVDVVVEDAADPGCNLALAGNVSCCGGDCGTAATAAIGLNTTATISCGGSATNALGAGAVNAQWFDFTPPSTGLLSVSACATATTDTRVTIHDGTCGALTPLVGSDDACGLVSEILDFTVTGGTTYYIEWDDRWDQTSFDWELSYIPCLPAAATASTGTIDCGAGTYEVFVILSDLGTSATVDISSDVNGVEHVGVSTLTSYTMGPYPLGTPVTITVLHDSDPLCDLAVGTFNEGLANCPIATFPYCQDFDAEGLCTPLCGVACPTSNGYVQDNTDGTDWSTHTGGTTSGSTGPSGAFNGANYMYVEASSPCNPSVVAVLFTNEFDISAMVNEPQISLYYHMLGADMGTLDIDVESPSGSGNFTNLFSISGDQGGLWNDSGWLSAFVGGPVIRFRITGTTGSGFNSDIAIDQVCVRERPNCTSPTASALLVEDCGLGSYTVDVTVTDLGDGASVDISSDQLGVEHTAVGLGTYTMGPYVNGTTATITVEHELISACDILAGTFASCCGGDCGTALAAVLGTNITPAIDCGGGATDAAGGGAVNAQWFEYTAAATGILTAASCDPNNAGGIDTRVSFHNGTCGTLNFLTSDDDGCTLPGLGSSGSIFISTGETVYIEWDDRWDATGFDWDLSLTPCTPPVTDLCASQVPTSITPGDPTTTYNVDANCSSDDAGIAGIFGGVAGTSWITFDLTACSDVVIDFCGTTDFTNGSLNMYKDCGGAQLVNSQNFDFSTCGDGNPSIFYVSLPPGSYKYPVFFGVNYVSNLYTVNVTASAPALGCAPDVCGDAEVVICGDFKNGTTVSNTATQGPSVCLPNHFAPGPDAWYVFTGTGDLITVSTCAGTVFNSMVTVYEGTCGSLTCLTGNDDGCGTAGGASEVSFLSVLASTYYIAVHGPNGLVNSTGEFSLDISCNPACTPAVNQDCASASALVPVIVGTGVPVTGDNTCAFADANPSCDITGVTAPGAIGVWYSFNTGVNTSMYMTLDDNTSIPALTATASSYALYTGTCGTLTEVACAINAGGTGVATFAGLDAATDYYLMIFNEGGVGVEGTFELTLEFPAQLDAAISSVSYPTGTICTTSITPEVVLTNNGQQVLTSVDITYDIDAGTPVVFNWTGSLAFGSSFNVTLPTSTTTTGAHVLNVATSNPNAGVDEIPGNDATSEPFDVGGEAVDLHIFTDNYAAETSWEMYDSFFLLAASGGGAYPNNSLTVENLCLSTIFGNCFSFYVYDSFGDGICCSYGSGYWELQAPNGDVVVRDLFHGSGTAAGSDIYDGDQSPSATTHPGSPGYALGHQFCLPLGPSAIGDPDCGVMTNGLQDKVTASFVPGASNYQFQFSNPDAAFRRFIAPGGRDIYFYQLVPNTAYTLVPGVTYFCSVRADQGVTGFFDDHFGPGCEMAIDAGDVPGCTQLIDNIGASTHSCGVTRSLDVGQKIWASPVLAADEYRFRFENVSEGYLRHVKIPTYVLTLNTWATLPLQVGSTYDVSIELFTSGVSGGFCGAVCQVTIIPAPVAMSARIGVQTGGEFSMYPNPVRDGMVQLTLNDLPDTEQTITVDIYDLFGKLVVSKEYGNSGSAFNTIVELGNDVAAGTYKVNVIANDQVFTETLIVQ